MKFRIFFTRSRTGHWKRVILITIRHFCHLFSVEYILFKRKPLYDTELGFAILDRTYWTPSTTFTLARLILQLRWTSQIWRLEPDLFLRMPREREIDIYDWNCTNSSVFRIHISFSPWIRIRIFKLVEAGSMVFELAAVKADSNFLDPDL